REREGRDRTTGSGCTHAAASRSFGGRRSARGGEVRADDVPVLTRVTRHEHMLRGHVERARVLRRERERRRAAKPVVVRGLIQHHDLSRGAVEAAQYVTPT